MAIAWTPDPGTYPPKTPKTLWCPIAPSLRKKLIFWRLQQTALESPKIDICQNWPNGLLGDVASCLETKFDRKIPMGSVPKCRKEIAAHDPIRWFKCKLKPPKKYHLLSHSCTSLLTVPPHTSIHFTYSVVEMVFVMFSNNAECKKLVLCACVVFVTFTVFMTRKSSCMNARGILLPCNKYSLICSVS